MPLTDAHSLDGVSPVKLFATVLAAAAPVAMVFALVAALLGPAAGTGDGYSVATASGNLAGSPPQSAALQ